MLEKIVKLYAAQRKPVAGDVIVFLTRQGEWCFGNYEGEGVWLDWSANPKRNHKTKDIHYWHYVIELED